MGSSGVCKEAERWGMGRMGTEEATEGAEESASAVLVEWLGCRVTFRRVTKSNKAVRCERLNWVTSWRMLDSNELTWRNNSSTTGEGLSAVMGSAKRPVEVWNEVLYRCLVPEAGTPASLVFFGARTREV